VNESIGREIPVMPLRSWDALVEWSWMPR